MSGKLVAAVLAFAALAALVAQAVRLDRQLEASKILRGVQVMSGRGAALGGMPAPLRWHQVRLLTRAARLAPAAEIELARGDQLLALGRPAEAAAAFRRSLALAPRAEAYLGLGRALEAAGDAEPARQAYERAAILDPRLARQLP